MKIDRLNSINFQRNILNDNNKTISFKDYLNNALNYVDSLQKKADNSNILFAAGKMDNIHKVMIDSAKADIALQLTIQVRNKIMDAYNEIMRMQL